MLGDRDFLDPRLAVNAAALVRRGPKGDLRAFVAAVLRTGTPWRDLAEKFGRWDRIYRRYRRWAIAGRWDALHRALDASERAALLLIDSTIVKAHPHAAGALRKTGGQSAEALGRSRGGFTTKVHALLTERGRLVRYVLTGGERNDITQACSLVVRREAGCVVGDRGYDADAFLGHVKSLGMRAVIPSRSERRRPRRLDRNRHAKTNIELALSEWPR